MPQLLTFSLVSRVMGLFLLATAAIKLHGLGIEPIRSIGFLSSPTVQAGLVASETILGIWLLVGTQPIGQWLVSLVTFSVFATVSCYQGWIGQASCGCFGTFIVSPWYAVVVDVVALTLLVIGRPDLMPLMKAPRTTLQQELKPVAICLLGVSLLISLVTIVATWNFGSIDNAVSELRGERVSIRPHVVDVGTVSIGELRDVDIRVLNQTDAPIRLLGGTVD